MSPKQIEAVNEVHRLMLEKKYDEVDENIQKNKKLLFGKVKKGTTLTAFDLKDEFGETVLVKAIRNNEKALVMDLMDKGATVDITDNEGETPLMIAAKYGELEIVKVMLKKANRDARTTFTRKTALHYAAEQDHLDVVSELLECGCDPLIEDSDGKTALQLATDKEVKDALRKVMKSQRAAAGLTTDIDEDEEDENVPKKKKDPNDILATDDRPRSYSKDEEMKPFIDENKELLGKKKRLQLQYGDLQKKRAPRNAFEKVNALDSAARKKFLGLREHPMDDLVKKFHDLVLKGNEQAALEEVEEMLTETRKNMKVDRNAADEFGETALMKASRLGYDEMVAFLLLYRCDIDAKDIEGYTALMKAAQFGKKDCCTKLIGDGADINATSRKGKLTALMLAAQRGHGEICEMLIAEGANHQMLDSVSRGLFCCSVCCELSLDGLLFRMGIRQWTWQAMRMQGARSKEPWRRILCTKNQSRSKKEKVLNVNSRILYLIESRVYLVGFNMFSVELSQRLKIERSKEYKHRVQTHVFPLFSNNLFLAHENRQGSIKVTCSNF